MSRKNVLILFLCVISKAFSSEFPVPFGFERNHVQETIKYCIQQVNGETNLVAQVQFKKLIMQHLPEAIHNDQIKTFLLQAAKPNPHHMPIFSLRNAWKSERQLTKYFSWDTRHSHEIQAELIRFSIEVKKEDDFKNFIFDKDSSPERFRENFLSMHWKNTDVQLHEQSMDEFVNARNLRIHLNDTDLVYVKNQVDIVLGEMMRDSEFTLKEKLDYKEVFKKSYDEVVKNIWPILSKQNVNSGLLKVVLQTVLDVKLYKKHLKNFVRILFRG